MNLNVDDFDNLDSTSKSRGFEIMAILRFEFQNAGGGEGERGGEGRGAQGFSKSHSG